MHHKSGHSSTPLLSAEESQAVPMGHIPPLVDPTYIVKPHANDYVIRPCNLTVYFHSKVTVTP